METKSTPLETIVNLAKRRGFIFSGSDIYGGLANSWDYGPLGVELKNNIQQEWWQWFVQRRTDMVGIDAALIMNPKVWEASGHVQNFTDPLVECKNCHQRFRADQIKDKCPNCGGEFMSAKQFNLLFKTFMGPVEDKAAEVYLRGEIAQAMFVDFPLVLQTTRKRLPFGIASQGKAFRNEITPGNFIFRTREFNLMEFEYFVREADWEKYFEYWLEEMKKWLSHLGVQEQNIFIHEISPEERAHYSKRTIDIEYEYPCGRKELYGLAYRSDFDLKNHQEKSGQDLQYTDPASGEKFLPHVIEPTFGLDRTVLVAMLEAYREEEAPTAQQGKTEKRVVLKFPSWMAPYKAAVLPLMKKKELTTVAKEVYTKLLSADIVADYDETQSIGKRYRRQDEIGTPWGVTVDYETLKDKAVTIRDRDTMKQERIAIEEVPQYINDKLSNAAQARG
jgi:glycyl-tRNA synthetase